MIHFDLTRPYSKTMCILFNPDYVLDKRKKESKER